MIRVENLFHRYPGSDSAALDGVSIAVREGSLFGLLGPNGAGKTTLISLLTGMLRLQEGSAEIAGFSLRDSLPAAQALCSLVPQEYAFYPMLSGRENLAFFGGVQGMVGAALDERIEACLQLAALGAVADRQARNYSGGLKRRLNLAIGMLNRPRLLFLDEPTVGIDLQSRAFILDAIRALNQEGMTVVYTSHYMEEVEQLCDEIAIIDGGRVLMQDRLDALLGEASAQRLVIDLAAPLAVAVQEHLSHRFACRFEEGGRVCFELEENVDNLAEIFDELRSAKAWIRHSQFGACNLEEFFLALTQRSLRD